MISTSDSLVGMTILVTGASSGIGREACILASKYGATIVATGRNIERLTETIGMLEGEGHSYIVADLTNQADVNSLLNRLECPVSGVVFSAGKLCRSPVRFIDDAMMKDLFEINFFSVCSLCQKLLVKKKLINNASLVFIGSVASQLSVRSLAAYSASKSALSSYVKTFASEQGKKGIRANIVLPGEVNTPLLHNVSTQEERDYISTFYVLERLGEPRDIADAIVFLLSSRSSWITGTEFVVDGGKVLL